MGNEPNPKDDFRLPTVVVILLSIATGLLWLFLLLAALAAAMSGVGLATFLAANFGNMDGPGGDVMRVTLITWLVLFSVNLGFGTAVLLSVFAGDGANIRKRTRLLVRAMIVLTIASPISAMITPAMIGGVIAAIPVLLTRLPMALTMLAALICADRYMDRPTSEIF